MGSSPRNDLTNQGVRANALIGISKRLAQSRPGFWPGADGPVDYAAFDSYLSVRAFDLGDPARVDAAIKDVSVVLCVALPIIRVGM